MFNQPLKLAVTCLLSILLTAASSMATPAPISEPDQTHSTKAGEVYFEFALANLYFYLAQARGNYYESLTPSQKHTWDGLQYILFLHEQYWRRTGQPLIKFQMSNERAKFLLDGPKNPERFAATLPFARDNQLQDPIWFNQHLFAAETRAEKFHFSDAVRILIHELGHKVPHNQVQDADYIAKLIYGMIEQASVRFQSEGTSYEAVMVDSDKLNDQELDWVVRHELLMIHKADEISIGLPKSKMYPLSVKGPTQKLRVRFRREAPQVQSSGNISLRIPYLVTSTLDESKTHPENFFILLGPHISSSTSFYGISYDIKGKRMHSRVESGADYNFNYEFEVEKTLQTPKTIKIEGRLKLPNSIDNFFESHLVLEGSLLGAMTIPLTGFKKISSDEALVTYELKIKQPVSVEDLRVTANVIRLDGQHPFRIAISRPVQWKNVWTRKILGPEDFLAKPTESKKAFADLAQMGVVIDGRDSGFYLRIDNVGDIDIQEVRFVAIAEITGHKNNEKIRIPAVHNVNLNSDRLVQFKNSGAVLVTMPMSGIVRGSLKEFKLNDIPEIRIDGNTNVIFAFGRIEIIDKSLKTHKVEIRNSEILPDPMKTALSRCSGALF